MRPELITAVLVASLSETCAVAQILRAESEELRVRVIATREAARALRARSLTARTQSKGNYLDALPD